MNIDFDLIRDIVKALNDKQGFHDLNYSNPNYTEDEIFYHLYYVLQKGLAEGNVVTVDQGYKITHLSNLTPAGHEFYNLSQNDTRWNKTKSYIKSNLSNITIQMVVAYLKQKTINE